MKQWTMPRRRLRGPTTMSARQPPGDGVRGAAAGDPCRPTLTFLMEAHNGLSAKIVEEAGFRGIWASGLTISAALGVRDSNEASWTQVLEVLEFMADATSRPDPARRRHRLRQLQQRAPPGPQAVPARRRRRVHRGQAVPQDQLLHRRGASRWPTSTSSAAGSRPARTARRTTTSSIVARVEALIAGRGMDEALRRAEAYHAAGADAILIHSKQSDRRRDPRLRRGVGRPRAAGDRADDVLRDARRTLFREAGISIVIWANHLLRASISRDAGDRRADRTRTSAGRASRAGSRRVREVFRLAGNCGARGGRAALPAGRPAAARHRPRRLARASWAGSPPSGRSA